MSDSTLGPSPVRAARPPLTPLAAAWLLAMLLGLQPLTTDLMLPALPALGTDLRAPVAPVQMTMTALILAFGLAQLVWGPVADRVGRRPVLLAGLALYVAASAGAALAGDVAQVISWRVVQGAALSVPVVCARAMLRDLYEPHEGALVMARALSGLGLVAIASPLLGGLLVAIFGWRATLATMGVFGAALWCWLAWRVPETLKQLDPQATRLKPLLLQVGRILAHPGFRAWALLVACAYAGLFVFLSGSGYVLIRVLGLPPAQAGVVMATTSLAYITGTFICRRWLPRHGLVGAVKRGSAFSIASVAGMALLAWTDHRAVWAVMLPTWLYMLGHGVHQPCGQAGAVGPFPRSAGLAAAVAGGLLALATFAIGAWLGSALDGTLRPFAIGLAVGGTGVSLVVWTLVRRHGEPPRSTPR